MSFSCEFVLASPVPSDGVLEELVPASLQATGWSRPVTQLAAFAQRLDTDVALVSAIPAGRTAARIAPARAGQIENAFARPALEQLFLEVAWRLAAHGFRTVAGVTSDQTGEFAIYSVDAARAARTAPRVGFRRWLPVRPSLSEVAEGGLLSDAPSRSAAWLSRFIPAAASWTSQLELHHYLLSLAPEESVEARSRVYFGPKLAIKSGKILLHLESASPEIWFNDGA